MKHIIAFFLSLTLLSLAQPPEGIPGIPSIPSRAEQVPPKPGAHGKVPLPLSLSSGSKRGVDPDAIAISEGQAAEYVKATGIEIASLITKHSGKRVILTSAAKDLEVFFYQPGPLTNRELMKLLKATLLLEGLAVIPDQLDPNIVRLLPSGAAQGITGTALPYIEDPLDLPETDELVIYRMHFQSLKPEEGLRIFQSVIGQLSPSGKITAVTNASSIIITENTSVIRQLLKIKEDIDRGSQIEERWIDVTYADVDEISDQLNNIFTQNSNNNNTTRTTRANTNTNTPPIPGLQNARANDVASAESVPIRIIPDSRTSRLLIIGRPSDLDTVEKLVKSYDIPSDPKTSFRYKLRYLRVNEFIPIASSAIERTLGSQSGQGSGTSSRSQTGSTSNNRQNNNNNRNTGQQGGSGSASANVQDIPTEPTAETVGKTLLVADNVANAIIVNGPPHHIEIVRNLINELDTASQQVVISAVIGSYSIGDNLNFGVDLAHLLQGTGSSFSLGGATNFASGGGIVDPANLESFANILGANGISGSGVSLYGILDNEFQIFVNTLESSSKFTTLNRPVITTRNNRVARLTSGQRIAVPSSTFNSGTTGTTTNIEFRDVVLELEIQPLINSDNEISLEISLVRDAIGQTREIGELNVPDINSETLTSSVTVPNGASIILGGLITEDQTDTKSGVPLLSRIPGLGRLFGSTGKGANRQELVILLRPEIINSTSDLDGFQRSFENDAPIARKARLSLPSTSSGMLPQQGQVTSAEDLSRSGSAHTKFGPPAKRKKKSLGYRRRR